MSSSSSRTLAAGCAAWLLLLLLGAACGLAAEDALELAPLGERGSQQQQQPQPQPHNRPTGICAMAGCNCTVKAHHWVFVKCVFDDDQDVDLAEGMIPEDTMELEVSHCRELRIQPGAFTGGAQLKRVHVSGIYTLVANKQAFQNLTAPNPLLEVSECDRVILESHAFKNSKGPLSIAISRCRHVTIKPNAFSWLLQISMKEVKNLELSSNSFKLETPQHGRHGPATKITLQSVRIPEFPTAVFPSTAAEIRMDNLVTDVIRKDAFCAMNILSVTISNASIGEIEPGAFSDRTLINGLEFVDVRMKTIRTGAFRAGANNLTIQYSRLTDVEPGAIDITVATVTFNNNEFQKLSRNSITFHQWNRISIEYNLFKHIEPEAISVVTSETGKTQSLEFSFSGNHIDEAEINSLGFVEISQSVTAAKVGSNHFKSTCNCNLEEWVRERVGSNTSVSWIMDSSYCMVTTILQKCFNLPEGYLGMRNYTQTICSKTNHRINCADPASKPNPSATPPSIGPHQYPRKRGYFDPEMSDMDELEWERRVIVFVCLGAVLTIVVVILASGVLYVRRRGVCPKLTSGPLSNISNFWFSPNSGMTAATSARSISRLSVHEYAGLQPETRILDVEAHQDVIEEDEGVAEGGFYSYSENKATQTLPEELTEEYLKELKDKLCDPENYSHARDMIEHLYDLIKVEESCNNNNDDDDRDRQRGEYDSVRPRIKRSRSVPRQPSINVGTEAPSLERLLPTMIRSRPQVTDYAEPRDHRIIDQNNHLYAELPGDETVPSTSRLTQPVLATLAGRAPQPLPPDVVNGHTCYKNGTLPKNEDSTGTTSAARDNSEVVGLSQQQELNKRPKNFLKALGGTIIGSKTQTGIRPNDLLGEYANPNEASGQHLYSELPEPRQQQQQQQSSPNKMANRPLPTKPDQQEVQT